MTENSIRDSLSCLKASGDYARTLLDITRRIEAKVEAARQEAERLEREAQAAADRAEAEHRKAEELEKQRQQTNSCTTILQFARLVYNFRVSKSCTSC